MNEGIEYKKLQVAYEALQMENLTLKGEVEKLRRQLGLISEEKPSESQIPAPEEINCKADNIEEMAIVHRHSPSSEKIALFMSLFRGREDVYAKRWESKKTGKSGYQPVCANEWQASVCDKRKQTCHACPNRKLSPLDVHAVEKHLRGDEASASDVIGVYPMLKDETCTFLAVDFDDEDFEKDIQAFRDACRDKEVPVAIERSRSGKGAHAWIFLDAPVSARQARRMGSGLLTYAMHMRSAIAFKSYDRLFPNQDTMPSGGFGNLIALPLQGVARKKGNSVFVDDLFQPCPDQWAYLSGLKKVSPQTVDALVAELCAGGELGILVQDEEEAPEKPWERAKVPEPLTQKDFPESISITLANMVYVHKVGITQSALNRIKRLGAFRNPAFYKAQAMRLPTYDKPRIISTVEDTPDYLGIPRGARSALCDMLDTAKVCYHIEDKTNIGVPIAVTFAGQLRQEQAEAARELLNHDDGVLAATTAFGKTVIGAYVIAERKVNTLILVHTQALLSQWKKSLETFLAFEQPKAEEIHGKRGRKRESSIVGVLGGGKDTLKGIVDVAILQSLLKEGEVKELVRNYGMVIVDECHHVSAFNFEKVLKYATARFVYGLSATPLRQDGHHPLIFMQCGAIRYRVNARQQAGQRPFDHFVVPRFTRFKKIQMPADYQFAQLASDLAEDELRNRLIADDVMKAIEEGRNPIVLTERTAHVSRLCAMVDSQGTEVISLVGGMSAKAKCQAMERLAALPEKARFVIVATGKYVGEGFDFPRLDTLFLAMPIAWKGKVAQYAGRLHRLYEGKSDVLIYDYVDIHIPVLERMYHKRVKGYAAIGYTTKDTVQDVEKVGVIHTGNSFQPIYSRDLSIANQEIIIVSPFLRKHRLLQMIQVLSHAVMNSVKITVLTRPPDDFKEADRQVVNENISLLEGAGIHVVLKKAIHQKFTIIDQYIVWYGSINFLSFGSSEETIMRLESHAIANELLGIL